MRDVASVEEGHDVERVADTMRDEDVVSYGEAGQRLMRCHQHCGSAPDQYIDRVVDSPVM